MKQSNRQRGKDFERKIALFFEKGECLVQPAHQKAVWVAPGRVISKSADFFNAFDMEVWTPDQILTLYVQATNNRGQFCAKLAQVSPLIPYASWQRVFIIALPGLKRGERELRLCVRTKDPDSDGVMRCITIGCFTNACKWDDDWRQRVFNLVKEHHE